MPNDFEFGLYFIQYQLYLSILEILILCFEINIIFCNHNKCLLLFLNYKKSNDYYVNFQSDILST
jgi:hypothetical protein